MSRILYMKRALGQTRLPVAEKLIYSLIYNAYNIHKIYLGVINFQKIFAMRILIDERLCFVYAGNTFINFMSHH